MKFRFTLFFLVVFTFCAAQAQTNVIFGYLADMGLTPQANVTVTLSLVSPQPKLINGIWVNVPTKQTLTTSSGLYSFNNLVGGQYEVDASGGFLVFFVQDSTSGSNNVVNLMTNIYVMKTAAGLAAGTGITFTTNAGTVTISSTNSGGTGIPLAAGNGTIVTLANGTNTVQIDPSIVTTNGGSFFGRNVIWGTNFSSTLFYDGSVNVLNTLAGINAGGLYGPGTNISSVLASSIIGSVQITVVSNNQPTVLSVNGNNTNYSEVNVWQYNPLGSADLTATANNGSSNSYYFNAGINGSSYVTGGFAGNANTAYILAVGPANNATNFNTVNLNIGTLQTNSTIQWSAGNGGTRTNMSLADGVGLTLNSGSFNGSLNGNANTATTASNLSGTISASQVIGLSTNGVSAASNLTNLPASSFPLYSSLEVNGSNTLWAIDRNNTASINAGWMDYRNMPDGWDSWFAAGDSLNEALVTNNAQQLLTNGLAALGFKTLSLGSGFIGQNSNGIPIMDTNRFPDGFPWLCNYLHTNGLKIGVYGVTVNGAGLSGNSNVFQIYGNEDVMANYFITNHVDYIKIDGVQGVVNGGVSYYPNESDFLTGQPVPPMLNRFDQSYLRFVNDLRKAPYPIYVNSSVALDTNGNYSDNILRLLTSWRATANYSLDKAGISIGGDMTGGKAPLITWTWLNANIPLYPKMHDYLYPDLDPIWGATLGDYQRHIFAEVFFGSIIQFGQGVSPLIGYHNWLAEFNAPLFWQIRARRTIPTFSFNTNACDIWSKANTFGGLDVLVMNKNYNELTNSGDGSTVALLQDFYGIYQYTNNISNNGTNYQYVFSATNVPVNFSALKLYGTNCIVASGANGAQLYAVGQFNSQVWAAAAKLYSIIPVASFQNPINVTASGVRDVTAEPWWDYWTTNASSANEPVMNAFNGSTPLMGGAVKGMQVDNGSQTTWGVNGAASWSCLFGVDDYGHGAGLNNTIKILVDNVVVTNVNVTSGFTNLLISLLPTNQTLSFLVVSNRAYVGNPQFNYTTAASGSGSAGTYSIVTGGVTTNLCSSQLPGMTYTVWPATNVPGLNSASDWFATNSALSFVLGGTVGSPATYHIWGVVYGQCTNSSAGTAAYLDALGGVTAASGWYNRGGTFYQAPFSGTHFAQIYQLATSGFTPFDLTITSTQTNRYDWQIYQISTVTADIPMLTTNTLFYITRIK